MSPFLLKAYTVSLTQAVASNNYVLNDKNEGAQYNTKMFWDHDRFLLFSKADQYVHHDTHLPLVFLFHQSNKRILRNHVTMNSTQVPCNHVTMKTSPLTLRQVVYYIFRNHNFLYLPRHRLTEMFHRWCTSY